MGNYILLYADKKPEDNICIKNMFKNNRKINLGWTDFDYNNNMKIVKEQIMKKGVNQIIFLGLEIGWNKFIRDIKKEYKNLKIKIICNTQDSLLYYEYERNNFFDLLKLSKDRIIDDIAFLRKGQCELYRSLGYKCSYLMQNYIMKDKNRKNAKKRNDVIDIGIYPLNYTWDKNIFNQLCIGKFIEDSNINYNPLDERMTDFLNTMEIKSTEDKLEKIDETNLSYKAVKNDINISCAFTEYLHPLFFISMEQAVPCLIGNTSDLFKNLPNKELEEYVVTIAEDNAIINSEKVKKCIEDKDKIISLYKTWKKEYNKMAEESIKTFIGE